MGKTNKKFDIFEGRSPWRKCFNVNDTVTLATDGYFEKVH